MAKVDFEKSEAVFISWDTITEKCSDILSALLQRKINAWASSDEPYMREWGLYFGVPQSALSKTETETVLKEAGADDYDWDANDFGEFPVTELTASVAIKLIDKNMHLKTEFYYPEDEGVWLFQKSGEDNQFRFVIQYHEIDCNPDVIEFSAKKEESEVKKMIEDALQNMDCLQEKNGMGDCLGRLDLLVEYMEEKLHTKVKICGVNGEISL